MFITLRTMMTPSFTTGRATEIVRAAMALNPATLIRLVEDMPTDQYRRSHGLSPEAYPWIFCVAVLGYYLLGVLLRHRCLANADNLLGRSWSPDEDAAELEASGSETPRAWGGVGGEGENSLTPGIAAG